MSLWPRTISILISNWPQTRKFNQLFKSKSREDRCFSLPSPYSRVGHALRPILKLWLVKIWQVSSRGKFLQHLETCLLWQLKLTEFFFANFSTGYTKWNTAAIKIESLLLFMACLLNFWFRNAPLVKVGNPISDGIVFVHHAGCRLKKSQAILALLDSFQELHLGW